MTKYEKDKKFYWLQLKEDFFEEDAITWLEEQENGEKYSLFYLKLCLKSLKTKGVLIRKVGDLLVPYDKNRLAEITRTDVDTVVIAMELLQKIGLVKILSNGEIYCTQVENMIGEKSIGAFKKQQQRLLAKGGQKSDKGVDKRVDNCPTEIELEIELEQELEQDMQKVVDVYEENIGLLGTNNYLILKDYMKDGFSADMIIYAINLALKQNKRNLAYIEGILKNWELNSIKTLGDAKQENENHYKEKSKTEEKIEYKETKMTEEEYFKKIEEGGKRYV